MKQCSVLLGRRQVRPRSSSSQYSSLVHLKQTVATTVGASSSSRDEAWAGSALFLLSSMTATSIALCETVHASQPKTLQASQPAAAAATTEDDDSEPQFPMYDNVPDEDVDTDCFLCRTHRQGPCRTQWRNFEYCAKDHPEEEGATKCSIYVQSFQECWMKHLNLYLLIAMTLNQERVQELEEKFTQPEQRAQDLETHFQWQEWNSLLEQDGFLDSCQQVKDVFEEFENTTAIWKVYESLNEEPFVVNVFCQVPTRRQDGRLLRVIYAVDQENRTIGLADYNQQHEIDRAESEGHEPDLEYHRVVVSLIPGVTEGIKIKAVYATETNEEEGGEGNISEGTENETIGGGEKGDILVESEWIPLPGIDQSLQATLA